MEIPDFCDIIPTLEMTCATAEPRRYIYCSIFFDKIRDSLMKMYFFLILAVPLLMPQQLIAKPAQPKVGVFVPLTGPGAAWGIDTKNILEFANKKIANSQIKLIVEDDRCSGKHAVTAAHKLSSVDNVDYAFGVCVASVVAGAPIFEKAKTLVMAVMVTSPDASTSDYVFRSSINNAEGARKLFNHIALKHQKLAILSEDNDYSTSILNHFLENAEGSQLKLHVETFTDKEKDFRSILSKLRGKKIDALFINSNLEPTFLNILKQANQLDLEYPIYGAYLPGASSFLSSAGNLSEGIIFVDFPEISEILTQEGKRLFEEFVDEYGPLNSSDFAFAATYEAFRAAYLGIKSSKDSRKFLLTQKFSGIFGDYHFDSNGDIVGLENALKIIKEGKSVSID